jgi:diacylglycerol kinase family enzyme
MGGDGSLGNILTDLKKIPQIYSAMPQIRFCLLPFGTGNDTGRVFGWGSIFI